MRDYTKGVMEEKAEREMEGEGEREVRKREMYLRQASHRYLFYLTFLF